MERLMRVRRAAAVFSIVVLVAALSLAGGPGANAAPYAAMVMDARSGKVLHSRNADTRLHPASLTKMMTLYVVFDAVRRGEIGLDDLVTVSHNAASEPPSKLYLKAGQRIALRYLIRASAVKSANDAATAMAEAVSGSEAAFTARMTATARALGMGKTTFKNAHGLTQAGHLSTARDMTVMGRALFYHFPEYYNLFSRNSTSAGGKTVYNTNRKLLAAYRGADGIKTGYTRAAGFNLVASAERGDARIIATMFGGSTAAARNRRVAELLSMGFERAPSRVAVRMPPRPNLRYAARGSRAALAVEVSRRPPSRPSLAAVAGTPEAGGAPDETRADLRTGVALALSELDVATAASTATPPDTSATALVPLASAEPVIGSGTTPATSGARAAATATAESGAVSSPPAPTAPPTDAAPDQTLAALASPPPPPRPVITFSTKGSQAAPAHADGSPAPVVVERGASDAAQGWGIAIGTFASRYEAERELLKTALIEIETLDGATRDVVRGRSGFDARFTGMDERTAALACQRLSARQQACEPFGP